MTAPPETTIGPLLRRRRYDRSSGDDEMTAPDFILRQPHLALGPQGADRRAGAKAGGLDRGPPSPVARRPRGF
jgi:hypothetical protein